MEAMAIESLWGQRATGDITETDWRDSNSVDPAFSGYGADYPAAEEAAIYFDLAFGNIEDYPKFRWIARPELQTMAKR